MPATADFWGWSCGCSPVKALPPLSTNLIPKREGEAWGPRRLLCCWALTLWYGSGAGLKDPSSSGD